MRQHENNNNNCIFTDTLKTYNCSKLYYISEEVVIKTCIGIRPCGFIDFFHVLTDHRFPEK